MGNSPSAVNRDIDDSSLSAKDQKAFNILQISPNGPASRAKLNPFFDFIISVNGINVVQETPNVVAEMAKTHIDKPLRFNVYNSRTDTIREISIVPSNNWGGSGLLGCSIRYSTTLGAVDRFWRVVEIFENSPAQKAGFIPTKDWIIGAADLNILNYDDFNEFLIQNKKHPIRLIVYNSDQDACRVVSIVPDFEWGGPGCLGCDIGTGMLNRIPIPKNLQSIPSAAVSDRASLLSYQQQQPQPKSSSPQSPIFTQPATFQPTEQPDSAFLLNPTAPSQQIQTSQQQNVPFPPQPAEVVQPVISEASQEKPLNPYFEPPMPPQSEPIQQHIIGSSDNGIEQSKDISDYFANANNADDIFEKNSNRKNSSSEYGEVSLK
jgi:hypothetical protein